MAFDGNKRTHWATVINVFLFGVSWGDRTNGLTLYDDLEQHVDQQLAGIIQQLNASDNSCRIESGTNQGNNIIISLTPHQA